MPDGPQGGRPNTAVTLGFIPLVDCAALVVAQAKGFAEAEGLELRLVRETSWANIRDLVALGHLDAAHMLGPMAIAATLGIGRPADATIAPLSLGLGGNAITLSSDLFAAMRAIGGDFGQYEPASMGAALRAVLKRRRPAGLEPPTLAVVHPFSGHHYELRYWLAACGIDPDADVRLTVLPPPRMVEALVDGRIQGFCAGEPWNSLAVEAGAGVIAVTKSALWRQGPEKVLGLRAEFAERRPDVVAALIRALVAAAAWAGDPRNGAELAALLAGRDYLDVPAEIVARALAGRLVRVAGQDAERVPDFFVPSRHAANFPWRSHAQWFYAQMVRWGHVAHSAAHAEAARNSYRPDLFRAALRGAGTDLPRADAKIEGALRHETPVASRFGTMMLGPDGFFDGKLFDPDRLDEYIGAFGSNNANSAE